MYYPYQNNIETARSFIDEFGGLNRNISIGENEFADVLNMTSDNYPLLSPRKKRTVVKQFGEAEQVTGFACKEAFVYTNKINQSQSLYVNGKKIDIDESVLKSDVTERTIIGMGAYAVIFPDKYYINLVDLSDRGEMECRKKYETSDLSGALLKIEACTIDGEVKLRNVSRDEPSNKTNGTAWVDTSGDVSIYKVWDDSTKMWQQVATTYLKLSKPGIGKGFSKWDGISISGLTYTGSTRIKNQVEALNQRGVILYDAADDYIIIAGLIDMSYFYIAKGTITFERTVPDMDFVVESNNRLWGCKYGLNSKTGKVVNEIYACKQGDPTNWNSFIGVSTDSYAASVGSDGSFTGAITYLGYPIFFKERCLHKVYGTMPSNYQISTTECRGVAKGNAKSLAIVNNVVCYRSPVDFCLYDGSLPESISRPLGDVKYTNCVSGGVGNKLYISATRDDGETEMLVFDMSVGVWHKESGRNIINFQRDGHVLYFLAQNADGRYTIESVNSDYNKLINTDGVPEDSFEWSAESGDIGFYDANMKYVHQINIRAKVDKGAFYKVFIKYDDGKFEQCFYSQRNKGINSSYLPIMPKRCDHFRIKIAGKGNVDIISISKTLKQGSDIT
ncbi:MAG: hypothetical protein NC110_08185 [Ruminococcus sp.]|nr:hypothetical protein [Ruminococcus sp.]